MSFQSRAVAFIAVGILFLASNWFLKYHSNLLSKGSREIVEDLWSDQKSEELSASTSGNLVINIEEAVQQVKTFQREKVTFPTAVPEPPLVVSEQELPPESTITVKDLANSIIPEETARKKTSGWQPLENDQGAKNFPHHIPLDSTEEQHSTSLSVNTDEIVNTNPCLPIWEKQVAQDLLPQDSTISVKDLSIISSKKEPSGNVKIIADNTPKDASINTQRFKNISEIKKTLE